MVAVAGVDRDLAHVGGGERRDAAVAPVGRALVEDRAQIAVDLPDRIGPRGAPHAHHRAGADGLADHQRQDLALAERRHDADPVAVAAAQLDAEPGVA